MAYINDLDIQITLATKPLTVQGFSKILILGNRTSPNTLIGHYGEYADLAGMITAGFVSTDPEYKMAALIFAQSPCPSEIAVHIHDAATDIDDALDTLVLTHNDWYGLLITSRDADDLHTAGTWALGHEKLFIGCTASPTALTDRNNIREAYVIHDKATDYPEAAWAGLCFPQSIGSITWKWKSPTGVVASSFTLTQLNAIRDGKGQTFSERSGIVYSDEGITTGGEYIDVIMSRDYIKARLGEALFALQTRVGKIPFDDYGGAMLEATIRDVLRQAGKQGIIAKAVSEADKKLSDEGEYMYQVYVPPRSEVPANDRAERKWTGITFSFALAGAVHKTQISGTITI
ncbi:MAG: DUF3383 family protein [Spirochaetota bacterium]